MDCIASNAATKNGLVLSSLPTASEILVQSPRATTECEFDLASNPDRQNRLEPWIANARIADALTEPPTRGAPVVPDDKHDGVLAQLKAKPLRGGPNGSALT